MHREAAVSTRLALVGISGSGKTTTGSALAVALGIPFIDLDRRIELAVGAPIEQLFASQGEEAFRRSEAEALAQVSLESGPLVLSTGGGVILNESSRKTLKGAFSVVWLDVEPSIAAHRLRGTSDRPLLGENPAIDLRRLREERYDLYAEVADYHVMTGDGEPCEETVRRLLALLPKAFKQE